MAVAVVSTHLRRFEYSFQVRAKNASDVFLLSVFVVAEISTASADPAFCLCFLVQQAAIAELMDRGVTVPTLYDFIALFGMILTARITGKIVAGHPDLAQCHFLLHLSDHILAFDWRFEEYFSFLRRHKTDLRERYPTLIFCLFLRVLPRDVPTGVETFRQRGIDLDVREKLL